MGLMAVWQAGRRNTGGVRKWETIQIVSLLTAMQCYNSVRNLF